MFRKNLMILALMNLLIFVISCGGGGKGDKSGMEELLVGGYLNGVFKPYSTYFIPQGNIESGKNNNDMTFVLLKRDGNLGYCELVSPGSELEKGFSKYKVVDGVTFLSTFEDGETSSSGFKILPGNKFEITVIWDTPYEDGTQGRGAVFEKLDNPSGMGLDELFQKSCQSLVGK